MMKKLFLFCCLILLVQQAYSQDYKVSSPDNNIQLNINIDKDITWTVKLEGKTVIEKAIAAMDFSTGIDFGINPKVKKSTTDKVTSEIKPGVPHKDALIKDEYTQLTLTFKGKYQLFFRAYNDGVAYQFVDLNSVERDVMMETFSLTFPEGSKSLFPQEESMYSHNERTFLDKTLKEIQKEDFCSLPVMFITDDAKVLYTETALHDYPGMFLRGNGNTTLNAIFPKYILGIKDAPGRGGDRSQIITKEADYIAKVEGKRAYPWRTFIITNDDRKLIESNLTYQLSNPQVLEDISWIKPGKVAWDWYNANNIYGVDFEAGLNTATYKYYIDFAADNGIEYVILDEGWTKTTTEILECNPDMDVPELIRYGKSKGVELILWVLWKPLDANLDQILDTYASWGVKGVKVDFMQRNDQYMVSSYERIARACAERELLVDFHGAFKPSGLRRMYPNMINYEGVRGTENNKWCDEITPEHNVTIPFTRMVAGPMDYTPGCMVNKQEINFSVSFERPMSLGTRAHQVAMYVIYEAPLQMMCESPSIYKKEQESVDFITQIPTTWDETVVLKAAVGDYVVIARKNGDKWYMGAMTDWTPRELEVDLSFLGEGNYKMEVFKDGINATRNAEDYKVESISADKNSTVKIKMAPGGGWAAILSK